MKKEIIQSLTNNFEEHSYTTEEGVEFWFARDLQHLLGYAKWENFNKVITKAKIACEVGGNDISNHFPDIRKTIAMPKGASKEIDDFMLTEIANHISGIREQVQKLKDQTAEALKKANKEIENILLN